MSTTNPECFVFSDGCKGNDLATAALMNGGGFGGGMWNNPIWAIVFLAALRNGGIFGNNNDGCGHASENLQLSAIREQISTNQNSTLLMDAIKGNSNAVHELATNLNCNSNAIQAAINGVQGAIANVSNQVGMTSAQVINSIQNGNQMLANTLQTCCCEVKQDVLKMGYENQINNLQQSQLIQNGFAQVGYASAEQTCGIKQAIADQTIAITSKIDAQESARKDREIATLTAQLATVNARAERQAELAPIIQKLNDIMCRQPNTVTIPYQPGVLVPNCVAWNAGLYGLGTYANGGQFG